MYKIYPNVKLKAVINIKNLVNYVGEKNFNILIIRGPFNFRFRQDFYVTFFIMFNEFNNIQRLYLLYILINFSSGTKSFACNFSLRTEQDICMRFFVCLDEFYQLADQHESSHSFHFLCQNRPMLLGLTYS